MDSMNYVVNEEPNMFSGEHHDLSLSLSLSDYSSSSSSDDDVDSFQSHYQPEHQETLQPRQQQVAPVPVLPTGQRFLRYMCDHPSCLHHHNDYGFFTMSSLVQHLQYCGFRNSTVQFGTAVQPLLVPIGTLYQAIIPTQRMLWYQASNPLSQQMVPIPMVPRPPRPSFQEVPGMFLFNNIGVSRNAALQNHRQDMGHLESAICDSGFFVRDISGDEARYYM